VTTRARRKVRPTRPIAKPPRTHLRADDRREQILDCALEVFASKGFHEASIADVCARARIARGTLYQYFGDKRDLLSALIDRIVSRIIDAVHHWQSFELPPGVPWTQEDNVAFIETRCSQIMTVVFADADTASVILRMARGTGFVREMLARIDEHVTAVIEADIRAAMKRGVLRSFEPHIVAQFIVGGIEKIVVAALDVGRPLDVPRITREIAVLLSSGFIPAEGHRSAPSS
jgi:TetR/AcrR family fatty acid metabolism transcriptional regulator